MRIATWVCPVYAIMGNPGTDHTDQKSAGDRREELHRCAFVPQDSDSSQVSSPDLKLWLMGREVLKPAAENAHISSGLPHRDSNNNNKKKKKIPVNIRLWDVILQEGQWKYLLSPDCSLLLFK